MAPPGRKRPAFHVLATFYNDSQLLALRARSVQPSPKHLDTIAKFLAVEIERDGINAGFIGGFALWVRGFPPIPQCIDIAVGLVKVTEVRDIVDKYAGIYVSERAVVDRQALEIFVSPPDLAAQTRVLLADNTPLVRVYIFPRGHTVIDPLLDINSESIEPQWDDITTDHKTVPPKSLFQVSLTAHALQRTETNIHLGHLVWLLTYYRPSIAERNYDPRHLRMLHDDLAIRQIRDKVLVVKELMKLSS